MALLIKKLITFMKKNKNSMHNKRMNKSPKYNNNLYFNCKKLGHFKAKYPLYKRNSNHKKKTMMTIWSDSDFNADEECEEK